jgi:CRP-like cAMP-binding protein
MKNNKKCLKSKNAVNDLLAYLSSHLGGTIEFDESIFSILEVQTLVKNKTIAREGEIYLHSFWLHEGYGRFFKLEKNREGITEEVTIDFCRPGEMIFVKEIFKNESCKEFHFQLASGTVIIPFEEDCANALNLTELEAARLIAKIMALDRPEFFRRLYLMQLNPRERYSKFLKYFGAGIEQYFLVKQVAGFLKMRPSYLSRLRGEALKKKADVIMYLQIVFFMVEFI